MGQLEDIQVFIRIVDSGGIGRAAEHLGIAKSAVSRRLSELEGRLGIKLINRTTRSSSLTEAGRQYYERALKLSDDIADLNAQVSDTNAALSGTLRLAVPLSFGLMHLSSAIDVFAREHPGLTIQIDFSDRQIDIVEEGFDIAFRIADLKDSTMQARRIAPVRHILAASPQYLERVGTPSEVEQLKEHEVLKYASSSFMNWRLIETDGKNHSLHLSSRLIANNGDFLRDMAIAGHGIVMLPTFIVWQAIAMGDLVRVLPEYSGPTIDAYAVYPQTRFLARRSRLLVDFLAGRFGENPYWDQAI